MPPLPRLRLRPEGAPAGPEALGDHLVRPLVQQAPHRQGRAVDLLRRKMPLQDKVAVPLELGLAQAHLNLARLVHGLSQLVNDSRRPGSRYPDTKGQAVPESVR